MASNLKHERSSNYSHKEVIFCYSTEHVHFIWFSSIKFIEYLHCQWKEQYVSNGTKEKRREYKNRRMKLENFTREV